MRSFLEGQMNNENVHRVTGHAGNQYGIRVLFRGDNLLFMENEKGLICTIDAAHGAIFTKSIKQWDSTGKKMSQKERIRVTGLIKKYCKEFYNHAVVE
ncbi:hypothetical protein D7322_23020 [Sphingobacterium puteale]|uniref:Uncharacterized protein n=1 Tax=Sphingobacterium puteale TaxID=2420510 RepID=A0A420VS23_9SPHI|nr:hypothetical protein [Sphingobacterium puteale]RKO69114.1 hypothetical protein D7322_23020 [Sphingobacterium puteale]